LTKTSPFARLFKTKLVFRNLNYLVWKTTGFRITKNAPIGKSILSTDFEASCTIRLVATRTMTDENRLHNLILATRYIVENKIAGDMVECGVWRGGSMMAIAHTLNQLGVQDRSLILYDTFNGMTMPDSIDKTFSGALASDLMLEKPKRDKPYTGGVIAYASLNDVIEGMASTQYPIEKITYVIGDVVETLRQDTLPETISLLRLDTDWHESTRIELETLWPRLQLGGILILDDYDHWEGARTAVDDFFSGIESKPFMMKMNSGRIVIKSS